MPGPFDRAQRFLQELKRRKVYRVAATYAVVGFVLVQVADLTFVRLGLPSWTVTLVIVLVAMGFPLALVLAWAFEVTPEGVRRTPGQEHDEPAPGTGGSWKQYLLGSAAVFGVVFLAVWGVERFVGGPSKSPSDVSSSLVAVLPFSVQGSEGMEYLGEGMVNLLTTKFDGAGDMRSVDARAVLSHLKGTGDFPLHPEDASSVARRFGAGLFVLGDIVEVGGHLTINATLYDSRGDPSTIGEGTVQGQADSISSLVDDLAAPLLASVRSGPGGQSARMAAVTTPSLPALKAYLQGESALRDGEYRPALEFFRRAVGRDTAFALGYYRLSIAAEWLTELDPMIKASDRALRHADRLNDRYRRLLTAFRAFRRGDNRRAEELYRSILATYPNDVEAWLYLGEVLFHTNPYQGEPIAEAWDPFTKVMEYEADNAGSLVHLARIAAVENRPAAVDSLVGQYEQFNPQGDRLLSVQALQATVQDDDEMWQEVARRLGSSSGATVGLAFWNVGVFGHDIVRAADLARLLTGEDRPKDERSAGFRWLAMTDVARGRWTAAERSIDALKEIDPLAALETRSFLYLLPYAPVSRNELRTLRNRLLEYEVAQISPSDIRSFFFSADDELHPLIRVYLLGRLNARLGEVERARARERELLEIDVREATGTLPQDLARGIGAEIALEAGDSTAALEEIEKVRTDVVYNYTIASFAYAEVHERFLRPELLLAADRSREAAEWYENHVTTAIPEIPYLALVHRGLGRSYERLGDRTSAVTHYMRFVELWSECDPGLRPLVDQTRERIEKLTRAGSRARD